MKILIFIFALVFVSCEKKRFTLSGTTMGTTYTIHSYSDITNLKHQIEEELDRIENVFSTYRTNSEISNLNTNLYKRRTISVSEDFFRVWSIGNHIEEESKGSFSLNAGGLVEIWGFGSAPKTNGNSLTQDKVSSSIFSHPKEEDIKKAKDCLKDTFWNSHRGNRFLPVKIHSRNKKIQTKSTQDNIDSKHVSSSIQWKKNNPTIDSKICKDERYKAKFDFSGIAKGYGIDRIVRLLRTAGIQNFMVEIGGEVCARTNSQSHAGWKIGIRNPAKPERIQHVIIIDNGCIATSGNSNQSTVIDKKRYTHIINPVTGYPIVKSLSSVSVYVELDGNANSDTLVSENNYMGDSKSAWVDAWATAFYVMGSAKSLSYANEKDIALLFISEEGGQMVEKSSKEWDRKVKHFK